MSAPAVSLCQPSQDRSIWPLVISQLLIMQSNSYKQQLWDSSSSNCSGEAAFPLLLPHEAAPLSSVGYNPEEEHADLGVCHRLSLSGKDDGCDTKREARIHPSLIAQVRRWSGLNSATNSYILVITCTTPTPTMCLEMLRGTAVVMGKATLGRAPQH